MPAGPAPTIMTSYFMALSSWNPELHVTGGIYLLVHLIMDRLPMLLWGVAQLFSNMLKKMYNNKNSNSA
jgi:predicted phage tail protein